MKHCPHCDGLVQDGAIKCKHCKQFIEEINKNQVNEATDIFKNPTKENIIIKEEKVKNQEIHVSTPQKTILQKSRNNEMDLGKIVAISVISISIFILFVYMLVNFVKSQNIEHKENINPITTEKPREIKTEEKPQIINNPPKIEEKPIEKSKEEKRGEMKTILQDVNLRSDSTSSSEKIHIIYEGDEVEVLGKITNSQGYLWYKVRHEGVEGWISYVGFERKKEEKIISFKALPQITSLINWGTYENLRITTLMDGMETFISIHNKNKTGGNDYALKIMNQSSAVVALLEDIIPVDIGKINDINNDGFDDIKIWSFGGGFIIVQFDTENIFDITNGVFLEGEVYEKGNFYYTIQQKNKSDITDCNFKKVTKYAFVNGKLMALETKETNVKYRFVQEPMPDEMNGGVMCYAIDRGDYGKTKVLKNAGF